MLSLSDALLPTCICAGHVLNATKVLLCPDASGVILIGELEAGGEVIVVGAHLSCHTLVVLQARGWGCGWWHSLIITISHNDEDDDDNDDGHDHDDEYTIYLFSREGWLSATS